MVDWLFEFVSGRSKQFILAGVLSASSVVLFTTWEVYEKRVRDYIVGTTIAELNATDSRLRQPIEQIFEHKRKSEVGSLNVGSFWLTPENRAYSIYVYYPSGHTGKIFYRLSGVTDKKYVLLVMPNGTSVRMKNTESVIDLAKYVESQSALRRQGVDGIFETPRAFKELHAITFQLAGADVDSALANGAGSNNAKVPLTSGVEVNYVSFVSPAIHLDK